MQGHHAIGVVDDVTIWILGFKGDSFVWISMTINADLIELVNQFIDDVDVGSLGLGTIEGSAPVVKDYSTLAFKSKTFIFKMCQVDYMFVVFNHLLNQYRRPLLSSRWVKHRMKNQNPARHRLTFVTCKPVWKNSIRCVITLLLQHRDINVGITHLLDEVGMLSIDLVGELLTTFIVIRVHELVVEDGLGVRKEGSWLHAIHSFRERGSLGRWCW